MLEEVPWRDLRGPRVWRSVCSAGDAVPLGWTPVEDDEGVRQYTLPISPERFADIRAACEGLRQEIVTGRTDDPDLVFERLPMEVIDFWASLAEQAADSDQ